jgi:hypothetical protein
MPTPTGIALAMGRKLASHWCYQYSRLCGDAPKPVLYGKSTSSRRSSTTSISCTSHASEESTEVRSTGRIALLCRQVDDIAVACSDPTVAHLGASACCPRIFVKVYTALHGQLLASNHDQARSIRTPLGKFGPHNRVANPMVPMELRRRKVTY